MIPIIGPMLIGKLGSMFGNIAQIALVAAALWGILAVHDASVRAERDQHWQLEIKTQTEALKDKLVIAQREALAAKVARDIEDKAKKEELENEIDHALETGRDPLDAVFDSLR